MRKYELALSVVCMVAALLGVSACSSPSTDETITTAVKNRAGGDPSRRAWALYKDDTPIAAFWNAVDMTAVTDAENDPWLRGNRAGCDFLMTKLNDLNPETSTPRYRCTELRQEILGGTKTMRSLKTADTEVSKPSYTFPDVSQYTILYKGRRYIAIVVSKDIPFEIYGAEGGFLIWDGLQAESRLAEQSLRTACSRGRLAFSHDEIDIDDATSIREFVKNTKKAAECNFKGCGV